MQSKPRTPHRARWRLLASLAITVILFGMGLREPCAVGYGTFWRCFADALSR